MKRSLDIVLGTLLVIVTAPVLLITAIVLAISLRAWPFFAQERIGRNGKAFRFVKLRTLPPETPSYAAKYQVPTMDIPPVCRKVRTLHLDELPQLWLVVTGKMSLVGPRPEMRFLSAEFDPDFADRRTAVRPGCTGLWQISTACQNLIYEHPEFDELYLRNQSFRFDLWILMRTVRLLSPIGHQPLVAIADVPEWAVTEPVTSASASAPSPAPTASAQLASID